MMRELIAALSVAIDREFAGAVTIYTEVAHQDIQTPCVIITPVLTGQTQVVGRRYIRDHSVVIQYIADTVAAVSAAADKLFDAVEYLTLPGGTLVRGTGQQAEVVDGVLTFRVSYRFHVTKIPEILPDKMAAIKVNGGV